MFTGIIKAPFSMVANAGRGFTGLSEEQAKIFNDKDLSLVKQVSLYLLNNGAKGDKREWNNTESGNHGTVQLTRIYTEGEYSDIDCRTLKVSLYKQDKFVKEGERSFCKNEKGEWDFDE